MFIRRSSGRPAVASLFLAAVAPAILVAACKQTPSEPVAADPTPPAGDARPNIAQRARPMSSMGAIARPAPRKQQGVVARPVASVTPSPDDPLHGQFTLDEATKGVDGKGALLATIDTDMGAITCQLFEDKSPITVASFVGLARGIRPWKDQDKKWVKKPAYDGTIFHRIIKGFMIQGGDSAGTGAGEPGFVIPDEVWDNALHDRPGLLCMANRGPNTNGAQFFITDGPAAHLDNRYTIFGECAPIDLVHKIAAVEVKGEKPVTPPKIKKITIKRGTSPIPPPPPASASAASTAPAAPSASVSAQPVTPPEMAR